jgi:hypothetical protein
MSAVASSDPANSLSGLFAHFGSSLRQPNNANISIAPKKKTNKKKKNNKSKSNGDATKPQDAGKDIPVEIGDGEAELDDSEQSALVRVTPVQLPKCEDQHIILTAPIRTHQTRPNSQKTYIHKQMGIIMMVQVMEAPLRSKQGMI